MLVANYYNNNDIRIIKFIMYLLKGKGMTIKGVKAILNNSKSHKLDETIRHDVNNNSQNKEKIKNKVRKISKILEELKKIKNG